MVKKTFISTFTQDHCKFSYSNISLLTVSHYQQDTFLHSVENTVKLEGLELLYSARLIWVVSA